ncbi:MAG: galactosyldiacylglycerol synthase [Acidobacteriia bacterium]|nr:galactosyldiacylglycerol synthase [Terriglobia bacterium]
MRKLTIVFHHAGGGHRSAAEAIRTILTGQDHPWDVTLLDIQELLDPLDLVRRFTGIRIQDTYNLILRRGWTRFTPQLLKLLQGTIYIYHSAIVKALRAYWAEHPTDFVLSVIPHFNRELAGSLRENGRRTPFATLITDLADYPPRFWIERESEYIIAGTERAKQQALAMGHPADHVFETSGMVLKPKFYEKIDIDRASERKRLGLEPDCLTGIVLFGGHGSRVMTDIVRRLDESSAAVQLILICGHNQKLEDELKAMTTRNPKLVLGFTQNVEHYMAMADFFIGKPGPASISEALQFQLPVIVECNRKTLPQERYNAEWVAEKGFGVVVRSFREIAPAVQRLIEPSIFNELRRNTSTYSNRALFEVSAILDQCYEGTGAPGNFADAAGLTGRFTSPKTTT